MERWEDAANQVLEKSKEAKVANGLRQRDILVKAAKRMESRAVRNSPKSHNSNQAAVQKKKKEDRNQRRRSASTVWSCQRSKF